MLTKYSQPSKYTQKEAGVGRSASGLQALLNTSYAYNELAAESRRKQERAEVKRTLSLEDTRAKVLNYMARVSAKHKGKLKQFYAEADKRRLRGEAEFPPRAYEGDCSGR